MPVRNDSCSQCPLGDYVRSTGGVVCVPADERPLKVEGGLCDVLVIGQNPGRTENRNGIPFSGSEESLKIREALNDLGVSYVVSNAVKCHSLDDHAPTVAEQNACAPYLVAEIAMYNPRVILALGNVALHALTGRSGVTKLRGQPLDLRAPFKTRLGASAPQVLCTVHPAAAAPHRNPLEWGRIKADIVALGNYLSPKNESAPRFEKGSPGTYVRYPEMVALDLEGSTANLRRDEYSLYLAGIMGMGDDKVVHLHHDSDYGFEPLADLFHKDGKVLTFNGLSYDEPALRKTLGLASDTPLPTHYDLMLIAYLTDETDKHISLQNCAIRHLGVAPWKEEGREFYDKKTKLARRPETPEEWKQLETYNARDVSYTAQLFPVLWPKLSQQQQRLYLHLMQHMAREAHEIEANGIHISRLNLTHAKMKCVEAITEALDDILPPAIAHGMGDFNPNSAQQIAKLLYEKMRLPVLKRTEGTKSPSTDQEALKLLVEKGHAVDLCRGLLKRKEYNTLLTNTLNRYESLIEYDGRVHFPYHLVRTETGRLSGPAQQMSRKPWMRRIITAEPGNVLISADQSQIELRTMAWRSREPTMLRVFKEGYMGGDIHSVTGLTIVNLQRAERNEAPLPTFDKVEYKEARDLAKPVNFGCLYGAEWYTVQNQLFVDYDIRVSPRTAKWLRDDVFFATFSGLPAYYDARYDDVEQKGYVESPFGRVRNLPQIKSFDRKVRLEAARIAINTDNQGDGSDITCIGLILARRKAPWLKCVMTIHDCNVFEVPKDRVDEAVGIITQSMQDDTIDYIADHFGFMIDVPLVVDCKVSEEWS